MRLADELLLLAYSEAGSNEVSMIDQGLAGGVLLDLALAGRVDMVDGRVVVADDRPLGDPVLDDALAALRDGKPRKPADWVGRLANGLRDRLLDGLVATGVLSRKEGRVLWVFPRTSYPAPGGGEPAAETDVRARLAAALAPAAPVDPRTAALAALVTAMSMEKAAVPDRPRKEVGAGLKAAAERGLAGDRWAAEGVRAAVEELQAAVLVAVTAAATVTTFSSSN